jgi:hypothetical protein
VQELGHEATADVATAKVNRLHTHGDGG